MLYARFETKKNIIFIFSLADWDKMNIFLDDLLTKINDLPSQKIDRTLIISEVGESDSCKCVNYSKFFQRFYTIIRKV